MQKNKEQLQNVEEKAVAFEEMEKAEEFGPAQDYLSGLAAGITIVAGIIAIT